MKKLLLLFCALLCLGGSRAWATDVIPLTPGGYIKNGDFFQANGTKLGSGYWCARCVTASPIPVTLDFGNVGQGTPRAGGHGVSSSSGNLGVTDGETLTIIVPDEYQIVSYTLNGTPTAACSVTPAGGSTTNWAANTAGAEVSASGINATSTTITFGNSEHDGYGECLIAATFSITVQKVSPELSFYLKPQSVSDADGGYLNPNLVGTGKKNGAARVRIAQGTGDKSAYYTLFNLATGKYIGFEGELTTSNHSLLTHVDEVGDNSYWTINPRSNEGNNSGHNNIIPMGGSGVAWNYYQGFQIGRAIGLWTNTDNASYWKFIAEVPSDFGDYAYTVATKSRGSIGVSSNEATNLSKIEAGSYSSSDTKQQFAFVYSDAGYCYLYNVAAGKFVKKDGSLSDAACDDITLTATGSPFYPWLVKFDDSHIFNISSGTLTWSNYGSGGDYYYDGGNMWNISAPTSYDRTTAKGKLAANVTYQIVYGGENSISAVESSEIDATLSVPNKLKRGYIESYKFYSDAACTNEITTVPASGNVTVYVKAELSASCPIEFSTDASPVWYVLEGRVAGWSLYDNNTTYVKASNEVLPVTTEHKWAFIGNPFEFKLKNGSGKYVKSATSNGGYCTLVDDGTETVLGLFKNYNGGNTSHIAMANYDGVNQKVINLHNGTGEYYSNQMIAYVGTGATFSDGTISGLSSAYFYPYEYYEKAITRYMTANDVYAKMQKAGTVGYPAEDATTSTELLATYVKIYGGTYNATVLDELTTKYPAYLEETDIVLPIEGKAYTIANYANDGTIRYLYNNSGTIDLTTESANADKFVCHIKDGKFIFAMNNGNYLIWKGNGEGPKDASGEASLSEMIENEDYRLTIQKFSHSNATADVAFGKIQIIGLRTAPSTMSSLIVKTSASPVRFDHANTSNFFDGNYSSAWVFTEADYYNKVNLNSDGTNAYASLYLPFSVTIPEGITAYAVTSQNGVTAHMEEIVTDGTLPKNTATILKKAGQTSYASIYLSPAENAGSYEGENKLGGTVDTKTRESLGTGTTYVLANIDGDDDGNLDGIGLYEYTGTYLAKGKAYLFVAGGGVKALTFDFSDADGINTVQGSGFKVQDSEIYNLAGQRMSRVQKGVNIVNGKKVLVK